MEQPLANAPFGYDVYTHTEVIPKPAPVIPRWYIGLPQPKLYETTDSTATNQYVTSEVTMQITADQMVELSISGEDRYDNPVDIEGGVKWVSSDEAVIQIQVDTTDDSKAFAVAVGPVGTASVTVSNDQDGDGEDDFQGSLAIDVVSGDIAEITIAAAEPVDKPVVEHHDDEPDEG